MASMKKFFAIAMIVASTSFIVSVRAQDAPPPELVAEEKERSKINDAIQKAFVQANPAAGRYLSDIILKVNGGSLSWVTNSAATSAEYANGVSQALSVYETGRPRTGLRHCP